MRNGWTLATAVAFAAVTSPAHATTFDLTAPTTGKSSDNNAYGNSYTYSTGSGGSALSVLATAYSYDPSTGKISTAALNIYGPSDGYVTDYGLGVHDQFESNTNPNHSIDSSGMVDFVVLQFSKPVDISSFSVGWGSSDTDATAAWLNTTYGSLNLAGSTYSAFNALADGSKVFKENGVVLGDRDLSIPTAVNTLVVYAGGASGSDYLKINAVTATTAVPEPATWGLMIAGFGAVGGSMRRRRKGSTTVAFAG